jgi:quercetin dioxygenase-like cupin family protein
MYSDPAGETHFQRVAIPLAVVAFSPPAPPVYLAPFTDAARFTFIRLPAGWYGDWHPTPRRQLFCILRGTWEVTVSDGEVCRLGPGSVALVEDTRGKGHTTRIGAGEDGPATVVQLAE